MKSEYDLEFSKKNFKKLEPHLKLKLLNKLTNKKPFAKIYLNPELFAKLTGEQIKFLLVLSCFLELNDNYIYVDEKIKEIIMKIMKWQRGTLENNFTVLKNLALIEKDGNLVKIGENFITRQSEKRRRA